MGIQIQKSSNPTLLIDNKSANGESRMAVFVSCNLRENGLSVNFDIHDPEAVAANREDITEEVMLFISECLGQGRERGFPVDSFSYTYTVPK